MIKLTFELPDEITALIKAQGYDVPGYIELHFVRPLVDALKTQKRQAIVDAAESAIATEVEAIKADVKVIRQDYTDILVSYGKVGTKEYTEETVTLEVDQQGNLLEAIPDGSKIVLQTDANKLK